VLLLLELEGEDQIMLLHSCVGDTSEVSADLDQVASPADLKRQQLSFAVNAETLLRDSRAHVGGDGRNELVQLLYIAF
jgi:hypothetical protein